MYKWKIEVLLKNGERVEGLLKMDELSSGEVVKKFLCSADGPAYEFVGFLDMTETHNIIIRASEIAILDISEAK